MTAEVAPGSADRPELWCVDTAGGTAVHLYDPTTEQILCRGQKMPQIALGTLPPFELSGCVRCARAAVKRGYDVVISADGERIPLDGFRPLYG